MYLGFGMEVLTSEEMERADRLAIAEGTSGFALMLSAGQAVAEAAMDVVEDGPIVVVAGRGNNGGDGLVAAAELAARGREVSVILLCERESLRGDAASAARPMTCSTLCGLPYCSLNQGNMTSSTRGSQRVVA